MPRRPNYRGERLERDRVKQLRQVERAEAKAAKTQARKDPDSPEGEPAPQDESEQPKEG